MLRSPVKGLTEIWDGARKLFPGLKPTFTIAMFAGLRATGNASSPNRSIYYDHDFIIEVPDRPRGLVNLGGIESPGLTSSPAIAQRVVELMVNEGEKLLSKRGLESNPPAPHPLSKIAIG